MVRALREGQRTTNEQVRSRLSPRADIYSLVRPAHCIPFICCPSCTPDSDISRPARTPCTSSFFFAATHTSSSTESHASCPFSPPCSHYHPSPQPRPPLALEACPRAPIRILRIGPLAPRTLSEAPIVFYQYASKFSGTLPRPCGRRRAGTCLFWKRSLSATPQRVLSGSEVQHSALANAFLLQRPVFHVDRLIVSRTSPWSPVARTSRPPILIVRGRIGES